MQTITLSGVVVIGSLAGLRLIVIVLAFMALRREDTTLVDLDARRLRLQVLKMPTRCRSRVGPPAPDHDTAPLGASEKSS